LSAPDGDRWLSALGSAWLAVTHDAGLQREESPMTITNSQSGTNVHEVSDGIYRINTPVVIPGAGGFSFN
jgi:hypothetical protein